MSLLSTADLTPIVDAPVTEAELQIIIDRVEAEITGEIGPPFDDSEPPELVETVYGGGECVFVKRPIGNIVSITSKANAGATAVAWSASDYFSMADAGMIEKASGVWPRYVTITYVPRDEREKRKQAIIDLVRIVLSHSALQTESVSGEYSFTAPPHWEDEKRKVMRRLTFQAL